MHRTLSVVSVGADTGPEALFRGSNEAARRRDRSVLPPHPDPSTATAPQRPEQDPEQEPGGPSPHRGSVGVTLPAEQQTSRSSGCGEAGVGETQPGRSAPHPAREPGRAAAASKTGGLLLTSAIPAAKNSTAAAQTSGSSACSLRTRRVSTWP